MKIEDLKNKSPSQLDRIFLDECEENVKDPTRLKELNAFFKDLMVCPKLPHHITSHACNLGLSHFCTQGNFEMVKFMLTHDLIKNKVNLHHDNDSPVRLAAQYGNIEIVDYLLNSPSLKEHANIHALNDYAFVMSCINNELEMTKYLIKNHEKKIDFSQMEKPIFTANVYCFENKEVLVFLLENHKITEIKALSHSFYNGEHELINYLIFDYKINITPEVQVYCKDNIEIQRLFKKRFLNERLCIDLNKECLNENNFKRKI